MKRAKKLTLNKQTVSKLTETGEIKGGMTPLILTIWGSCIITCNDGGGGTGTGGTTPPATLTNCHQASCKLKCN